jgi:hypothetical protein
LAGTVAPPPFDDYAYYAPLGAVIATTSSVTRSVRESAHAVAAVLAGAAIALLVDFVVPPGAPAVAVVTGLALLCGGWRVFGAMSVWVATSAIFVLILGQVETADYIGAFAGLIVLGAIIGVGVNLIFPPLPLTPGAMALDRLRDELVRQLRELAAWLEDTGPLEPDEWERRRRRIHPTARRAREARELIQEAVRANPRARRHGDETAAQARGAAQLAVAVEVVDGVVRLLVEWEGNGRAEVALGPRLRPAVAAALRDYARALGPADHGSEGAVEAWNDLDASLGRLRDAVRAERDGSGDDMLVAGSIVVALRRGADSLPR